MADAEIESRVKTSRIIFENDYCAFVGSLLHSLPPKEDSLRSTEGQNIQLSVEVESIERINEVFEKMSAGGKVTMPLQDTFWGARFGMLEDKFGIYWMFNHELKKGE